MQQCKLVAVFNDRSLAYAVSDALRDFVEPDPHALSVFEDGADQWKLEAYYDEDAVPTDAGARLAPLFQKTLPEFAVEQVPDMNWVAMSQAALPPVEAGRFTVHGSHDSAHVGWGPNRILIDAGEAFGTAHHATTLGCLLAVDRLARQNQFHNVLDLGCGSGVLAIAVARTMPSARIIATDLDAQSVHVARINARINSVERRIRFAAADGLAHPWLRRGPKFDLLIANILAGPLIDLAPAIARVVAGGGRLLLSGLLNDQAAAVIAAYRMSGFELNRHDRIHGWSTLMLRRNG